MASAPSALLRKSRKNSVSRTTTSPRSSKLVHAGLLETERGPRGGIRLARDSKSLTLLDIYEAAGGAPLPAHRCLLDPSVCKGCACGIGRLIEQENARLHKKMKETSIASLVRSLDKTQLDLA